MRHLRGWTSGLQFPLGTSLIFTIGQNVNNGFM